MLPTRETFRELDLTKSCGQEYKVVQIYTKKGTNIFPKRRLCEVVSGSGERVVIKAKNSGIVTQVLVKVDDTIGDGCDILELQACTHTAMMGNICCDCGVLLEEKDIPKTEAVSMLHAVPDLKIARNEAQKLGKEDIDNLLKQRKLVLLVDLDQTLIHTTNDNIPPDLKDVYHFQISHGGPWYHARLRPHTKEFLEKISMFYELHISTFGVREYAHHIAHFLDPDRMLFGQRILSRNECLDVMSKKANLDSLFPCGDNLVCIIDDRTDVWNYSPNVVQVLPYHFFRHTGDINAPQGLQKKENDDREGIDFKDIKKENIKTIGFRPGDTTVAEKGDDDDDEDKKNYSSDSDSDKDSKEVNPETKASSDLDSCKNSNNSDAGCDVKENTKGEKVNTCELFSVQCSDHEENEKKSESIESPDSLAKESLTNDGVIENVQIANKESDQCNMNKKNENASVEEIQVKQEDESVSSKRTEDGVNIKESNRRKDEEMECNNQPTDKTIAQSKTSEGQVFDVVDSDDYLLYLEDILKQIHKRFFFEYDASQQQSNRKHSLPDLKTIVPAVRKKVFNGVNIVFSGVVPQQMKLQDSKAYHIATSLGSSVSERLVLRARGDTENVEKKNMYTTHMVAANLHTEKVNIARKHKYIKIVTPNWLWKCAERWEHVEERLFPLNKETEKEIQRLPPHHCFSPDPSLLSYDSNSEQTDPGPSRRTRTQSGQLLEDVNPLMFFSPDEKNNMTDEVEKILSDDDDDDESDQEDVDVSSSDSNSNENDYEEDEEEGPRRKKFRGIEDQDSSTNDRWIKRLEEGEDMENDDELPSVIFRQGGGLPSDDSDDGESDDEGDLSRMGADLESLLS